MERLMNSHKFVVCLNNENYPTSLEIRKIYTVIPDKQASNLHLLRIIDESEEEYLYPEELFAYIDLSNQIIEKLALASWFYFANPH